MVSLKSHKKSWRQRRWFYPLVTILAAFVVLGILEATNVTHLIHHRPASNLTASSKGQQPNSVNYSAANPNDNAANNERKSSSNPSTTLDNGPTTTNTAPSPVGVIIVNARRSGTDVRVGNIVNGTTTGTCTLSATQAGQSSPAPVTAQVQQDVNSYDCGIMHISLPDTGTWQIKLTVTSGSNSGTATASVGAS